MAASTARFTRAEDSDDYDEEGQSEDANFESEDDEDFWGSPTSQSSVYVTGTIPSSMLSTTTTTTTTTTTRTTSSPRSTTRSSPRLTPRTTSSPRSKKNADNSSPRNISSLVEVQNQNHIQNSSQVPVEVQVPFQASVQDHIQEPIQVDIPVQNHIQNTYQDPIGIQDSVPVIPISEVESPPITKLMTNTPPISGDGISEEEKSFSSDPKPKSHSFFIAKKNRIRTPTSFEIGASKSGIYQKGGSLFQKPTYQDEAMREKELEKVKKFQSSSILFKPKNNNRNSYFRDSIYTPNEDNNPSDSNVSQGLPEYSSLPPLQLSRNRIINELIQTEQDYISDLNILLHLQRDLEMKRILKKPEQIHAMFCNVDISVLIQLHMELLKSFMNGISSQQGPQIGTAFSHLSAYLKMYSVYCTNHQNAVDTVCKLCKKSVAFNQWCQDRLQDQTCKNQPLTSFLIKPLQRICKYPLLLRELLKHTTEEEKDFVPLTKALATIEETVKVVNESKRLAENQQKILSVQSLFENADKTPLMEPTRRFIMEGIFRDIEVDDPHINLVETEFEDTEHFYFLFNDILLRAERGHSLLHRVGNAIKKKKDAPPSSIAIPSVTAGSVLPAEGSLTATNWLQLKKIHVAEVAGSELLLEIGHNLLGKRKLYLLMNSDEEKKTWLEKITDAKVNHLNNLAKVESRKDKKKQILS